MNNLILKEIYRAVLFSKLSHKLPSEISSSDKDETFADIHKILTHNNASIIENENCKCYIFKYTNTLFVALNSLLSYNNCKTLKLKDEIAVNKDIFMQYKSLEEPLIKNIIEFNKHKNLKKIYICGYKIGGALATVMAALLAEKFHNMFLISCFTFGAPEVGNKQFKKYFNEYITCNYRIVIDGDTDSNKNWPYYIHVGKSLQVDDDNIIEKKENQYSLFKTYFKYKENTQSVSNSITLDTYIRKLKTILVTYNTNLQQTESSNREKIASKKEEIESNGSSLSSKSVSTQKPKSPQTDDTNTHRLFPVNSVNHRNSDDTTSVLLKRIENIEVLLLKYIPQTSPTSLKDKMDIKDIVLQCSYSAAS